MAFQKDTVVYDGQVTAGYWRLYTLTLRVVGTQCDLSVSLGLFTSSEVALAGARPLRILSAQDFSLPLSALSGDVRTQAYNNIRAQINAGVLPALIDAINV